MSFRYISVFFTFFFIAGSKLQDLIEDKYINRFDIIFIFEDSLNHFVYKGNLFKTLKNRNQISIKT